MRSAHEFKHRSSPSSEAGFRWKRRGWLWLAGLTLLGVADLVSLAAISRWMHLPEYVIAGGAMLLGYIGWGLMDRRSFTVSLREPQP